MIVLDGITYGPEPVSPAQGSCPHRVRNREETECSACGSVKVNGRWLYLTADWWAYYVGDSDKIVKPERVLVGTCA